MFFFRGRIRTLSSIAGCALHPLLLSPPDLSYRHYPGWGIHPTDVCGTRHRIECMSRARKKDRKTWAFRLFLPLPNLSSPIGPNQDELRTRREVSVVR